MIEIENVSYCVNNINIIKNINLTLREKKICIIGANGSGKSTFARLLNGLQLPTIGGVKIDGLDTKTCGKQVRRKVGFIFQNPDNQIICPIVEDDVAFGLKNLGYSKEQINDKVGSILALYNMGDLRHSSSHLLSGGQKQLLAIAGVLVMEPDYIIFDEPTTLLDLKNKKMIFKIIENLRQNVIMITHDLELLSNFDRVIVFDEGRVIADDIPNVALDIYRNKML